MSVRIPEDAVWFGLETRKGPDHPWERFESEEGEKWWRAATVVPEELAAAEGLLPTTFVGEEVRATFSPADRRRTLGQSLPFAEPSNDDEPAPPDPQPQPQPEPPPPPPAAQPAPQSTGPGLAYGKPRRAPRQPRAHNGQPAPGPPTPADALRRHPPQVGPVVPLPPNADHNLMTFWTLQQLAQTQADRLIALVMSYNQHAIEAERARSEQVLQQTRDYFSAIEGNQRQLQAAMMSASKNDQTPVVVHQLQQHIQAQAHAIQALATKLEQLEDDDDGEPFQVPSFSDEPNNVERVFAGIQGIVGAVANSPMAEPLAEMLKRRPPVVPPQTQQQNRQPPLPFAFPPTQQPPQAESQPEPDGSPRSEDDIPPPPPQ